MLICGLKLTHDGCVALIKDNRLIFSYEVEKFNNNKRYSEIPDLNFVKDALYSEGYIPSDVDHYTIDGWAGLKESEVETRSNGKEYSIAVAPYRETSLSADSLKTFEGQGLLIADKSFNYTSYLHSTTHIFSAYSASEFSEKKEPSYVLVYDGGMYPRLYFFDPSRNFLENLGPLFMFIGNIYSLFSLHFEPFYSAGKGPRVDDLSVAGKVMAYIAMGKVRPELLAQFDIIYQEHFSPSMEFNWKFSQAVKVFVENHNIPHEDVLASFHQYIENLLVSSLKTRVKKHGQKSNNFCFVGGCSLNIKWNSAIRQSKVFENVFISPFTNDTGSAIGAACCEMYKQTGNLHLEWSVYSGPKIIKNQPAEGWSTKKCSIKELAELLHSKNEPVVFLNDKAELGPRALGNRSIIATAIQPEMKDRLNRIKRRESYRPVSPICIENRAAEIFSPGTPDPYMLFDHKVRENWKERIPAIRHLDGTARLQTISREENEVVNELLSHYEQLSGIPVLCNTSANLLGSGFFPDVLSATEWGETKYVWCDHLLYEKK
ncbi:carbamoyltransferase N-terminal domain-containing protein [Metabacillus idriensis]|uniref:carbamoyltransferase N-terminal domain-containing protein n=1 Tax=Metabacillus idriensis TaxID=324768 RepID=UPI00174A9254|nr:carbamoyltransferase N-terminal domain-containing protein [Metabacillus idriensis]